MSCHRILCLHVLAILRPPLSKFSLVRTCVLYSSSGFCTSRISIRCFATFTDRLNRVLRLLAVRWRSSEKSQILGKHIVVFLISVHLLILHWWLADSRISIAHLQHLLFLRCQSHKSSLNKNTRAFARHAERASITMHIKQQSKTEIKQSITEDYQTEKFDLRDAK